MKYFVSLLLVVIGVSGCAIDIHEANIASITKGPDYGPNGDPIPDQFILTWRDSEEQLEEFLDSLKNNQYEIISRCSCTPIRVLIDGSNAIIPIDGVATGIGKKAKNGSSGNGKVRYTNTWAPNITIELRNQNNAQILEESEVIIPMTIPEGADTKKVIFGLLDTPITPRFFSHLAWTEAKALDEENQNPSRKKRRKQLDCTIEATSEEGQEPSSNHGNLVAGTLLEQMNLFNTEFGKFYDSTLYITEIYSIPILQDNGQGSLFNALCALEKASAAGVDVIVASWGFSKPAELDSLDSMDYNLAIYELGKAIKKATKNGTPIVTAAGNDGRNISERGFFPAYFAQENDLVIAVGSIDEAETRKPYSNYSDSIVTLGANGTFHMIDQGGQEGTSFAAPRVATWVGIMRRELGTSSRVPWSFLNKRNFYSRLRKFKAAKDKELPQGIYPMDNE